MSRRSTGRSRADRDAALRATLLLALALGLAGASACGAQAEPPVAPPAPVARSSARQDSLRIAIRERLFRIEALQDSLKTAHDPEVAQAMQGLEQVIREMETQLRDLDVRIDERRLHVSNPSGNIQIDFPADWSEKVSQGLSAITATILAELPDSLDLQTEISKFREQAHAFNWDVFADEPPERRIIGSEIVSTGNDAVVESDERVTGNVVVLLGDATILGQVDGDVIVVGGSLTLADEAVVEGDAITVFGALRRDETAKVAGNVVAVGFGGISGANGMSRVAVGGADGLLVLLPLGVLIGLTLLTVALMPAWRLEAVTLRLSAQPGRSLLVGLAWLVLGHFMLVVMVAVLAMTIIGIPLALMLGLAYIVLGLVALGVVAGRIGRKLCASRYPDRVNTTGCIAAGLAVILSPGLLGALLTAIPALESFGRVLELLAVLLQLPIYCLGTGAILDSRFGGRHRPAAV
ncbi:MAG: hypothetical protein IPI34_02125 [bacterium]|nr:hypothetical protein [bacterium]